MHYLFQYLTTPIHINLATTSHTDDIIISLLLFLQLHLHTEESKDLFQAHSHVVGFFSFTERQNFYTFSEGRLMLSYQTSPKNPTKADEASCARQLLLHQITDAPITKTNKQTHTHKTTQPKRNKVKQKTAQRYFPIQKAEDKSGLLKSHLQIKGRALCGSRTRHRILFQNVLPSALQHVFIEH